MNTAAMDETDTQFVWTLLAAASGIESRLNRVLSNVLGVSFTEYQLLRQLKENHSGAATRVDLAAGVRLTPSAITRALKPLEKIGYIRTEKGERDARQSIATLTPAGEQLVDNGKRLVTEEIEALAIDTDSTTLNTGFSKTLQRLALM